MSNRKKLLIITLVLATVLVAVYFVATKTQKGEKEITLCIEYDGTKTEYSHRTNGEHVIDVLKELQDKNQISYSAENGAYGLYLTGINGRMANASENEYFALYVNGEYASFGVSEQIIHGGDVITLSLESWS